MTLERRRIGKTNIEVTRIGFGGGPIGGAGDRVGDPGAIIAAAWAGGIRYFDTAPLYGRGMSEVRLGAHLRTLPRDQFVLSSKVGRLLVDANGNDARMLPGEKVDVRYDYTYEGARHSLLRSLERLGLDRIDIVFCHDIDVWTHGDAQPGIYDTAARGILPALTDLRREGVIRAFGLGVNEAAVCSRVLREFEPDCFLLAGRFTLLEQAPLDELLPACEQRGVSIVIGGPFNSGLLAVDDRGRATYDYKPVDDARWAKAQAIRAVCARHGTDIRAAALQYPLRHPAVAAVIPGMWRLDEVQTNLQLMQTRIPDALWRDLDREGLARFIA